MAISYTDTAWNTGGSGSLGARFKDLVVSGAQVGDLLVVFAAAENFSVSGGTRLVATQAGSTSAWTLVQPAVSVNNDVDFIGGWATVTAAGSVTVRATLRANTTTERMGVAAFLIPAAEVGATYGWVGSGFVADADGLQSVTLAGSSTVLYGAGDWAATNMGTTTVPAGGTNHRSYFDTTNYAAWMSSWTAQAAGTRNYGPSGLSGHDVSGAVFRMDTASGSPSETRTATGGVTLGGTGDMVALVTQDAAGGVTIAGTASRSVQAAANANGGVILAGSGNVVAQVPVEAAGGVTIGGSGDASARVLADATGGVILSGDAAVTVGVTVDAAGGITLTGDATAHAAISTTATGGVSLGGTATATPLIELTASGGITLSGITVDEDSFNTTATGGITLGGVASSTALVVRTSAGGITLAGTTTATAVVVRTAVGGVTLTGTAVAEGQRDITVTGTLNDRRWAGTVHPATTRTGTIRRRWGGAL